MSGLVMESPDLAATERIGRGLGRALQLGDLIALVGPLGSGKTTLVKAMAAGAGVTDLRQVNSPTFVIVNEYEARSPGECPGGQPAEPLRIYHVDAYRLRGGDDLAALGFDEMISRGAVIVEWADRVAEVLPAERFTLRLEPTGATQRRVECTAAGPAAERLLAVLRSGWARDSGQSEAGQSDD